MDELPVSNDPGLTVEQAVEKYEALSDAPEPRSEPRSEPEPKPAKPGSVQEGADRYEASQASIEPEPEIEREELPPPQPRMTPNEEVIAARAELRAKANQINWERLRAENPGEYAAYFQEFKNAEQQLLQYESNLAHQQAQQHAQMSQAQIAQAREHLATENRKLVEQIPSWSNPEVREREVNQVRDYLGKKGYSQEEIDAVHSARDVKMVYDAMKAEQRPRRSPRQGPQKSSVQREIEKRNLNPHGMEAAALRYQAWAAK